MFKQDDSFSTHPKVLSIPRAKRFAAIGLWDMAGTWSARHLTDGRIPAFMLDEWGHGGKPLARLLVAAGLWEETTDGYRFHDWDVWQDSKDVVLARRAANARQQWLNRNQDVREAVRQRDHGMCRYCGQQVGWSDRRSARGGTYVFIDTDGPSTCENIVTACRGCATLVEGEGHGLTVRPVPVIQVESTPESQVVSSYGPDTTKVVSDPLPLPNPSPSRTKQEKNPPGGRKAPAAMAKLDIDVPSPAPSDTDVNASHVVAAWVTACEANNVKPTGGMRAQVGRNARELLAAGNDPSDVLAAATAAGAAGFTTIDRELARMKGRPRLTPVPATPAPDTQAWRRNLA